MYRKIVSEKIIGSAEEEANRIIAEAQEKGLAEKKEAVIEAKEEIHRMRQELDRDTKDRRNEISRQERRVVQKKKILIKNLSQSKRKKYF